MEDKTRLTLTRRRGEKIRYTTPSGEQIIVEVSRIGRNQVKIRSYADKNVRIERAELVGE